MTNRARPREETRERGKPLRNRRSRACGCAAGAALTTINSDLPVCCASRYRSFACAQDMSASRHDLQRAQAARHSSNAAEGCLASDLHDVGQLGNDAHECIAHLPRIARTRHVRSLNRDAACRRMGCAGLHAQPYRLLFILLVAEQDDLHE